MVIIIPDNAHITLFLLTCFCKLQPMKKIIFDILKFHQGYLRVDFFKTYCTKNCLLLEYEVYSVFHF